MAFWFFVGGVILGCGLGANAMWLYLMNKHAGRPVDWRVIGLCAALTAVMLFAVIGVPRL